jgi:hypothetical protein
MSGGIHLTRLQPLPIFLVIKERRLALFLSNLMTEEQRTGSSVPSKKTRELLGLYYNRTGAKALSDFLTRLVGEGYLNELRSDTFKILSGYSFTHKAAEFVRKTLEGHADLDNQSSPPHSKDEMPAKRKQSAHQANRGFGSESRRSAKKERPSSVQQKVEKDVKAYETAKFLVILHEKKLAELDARIVAQEANLAKMERQLIVSLGGRKFADSARTKSGGRPSGPLVIKKKQVQLAILKTQRDEESAKLIEAKIQLDLTVKQQSVLSEGE